MQPLGEVLTCPVSCFCRYRVANSSRGSRTQVHRHHPPLVYGRLHGTDPEHSTGAAVCETKQSIAGEPLYTFITYECVLL